MPWHEWREDFGMDERCDYLANLLYRGAGLTVKDASVVPGGVRAAGRAAFNQSKNSENSSFPPEPTDYSGEDDGMSGYVRRVVNDPGSNVRINRAGSVIVEDNTFDDEARALRDSEYVPRVFSKDKPDVNRGYSEGGYDPKKSEADEILRRVEAKRINAANGKKFGAVERLADVAPYGITLEPGARKARARLTEKKDNSGGGETKSPYGGGRTRATNVRLNDADEANKSAVRRPVPNRAASVRRRAPGASAPERAAGAAGVIRRRRVRVSVPAASNKRFAGGGVNAKDAEKKDASASVGGDGDASLWSSATKSRGDAPVSALRGVGSKSAARLASLGVVSVGDLAALSDARCAEIRKTPNEAEKGASVLGLRDKARRALGGAWET